MLYHVNCAKLSTKATPNLGLFVMLETKDSQVVRVVIGGIFVNVMNLDSFARFIANATSR
ncbi:hypothetical protein XH98_27380 [Bradyrhizobium sp. CCBAU 51745]|nr:hypothetical protein [Bradyrhizobium sp. CCBAU 51745]